MTSARISVAFLSLALLLALLVPPELGANGEAVAAGTVEPIALGKKEPAPLVLELRLEQTVEARFVPLHQLVEVTQDDDEVWDVVGDMLVRVREGGYVRRADIVRRLGRSGLAKSRFDVTGPAFCTCEISPVTGGSR